MVTEVKPTVSLSATEPCGKKSPELFGIAAA